MTVLRNNFGELLEPGLATVFFHEFDRYDPEWKKILKEKQSQKKFEEELLVTGLGIMGTKTEGSSVSFEDISQGFKQTYTHDTFAKAIRISQEMYEDDLYGIMTDMTVSLARSAMQREEVSGANILNNAFSGTAGSDSNQLIASDHNLSVGGTQSNELSTASVDLSVASLQEAIEVIENTKDERDLNVALRPKLLVVPTALQWTAKELLGSEYKPEVANNDVNALMGKGLQFTVNHYLTDADAWFLLADEHKLCRFSRTPLSFYKGNDFDTDDVKFKARMRYSTGFSDWRGVTGSAGE